MAKLQKPDHLRILWVSEVKPDPNSGAGGTEQLMVKHLRELGHSVETIWETDLPRRIRHGNLHYAFELPRTYARAIEKACRGNTFDIVTVNLGQSFYAAKRLKRLSFHGAFIVRSHGLDDHLEEVLGAWERRFQLPRKSLLKRISGTLLSWILRRHMKRAAQLCDGYIVSNSLDAAWLTSKHDLSSDRIAIIPQAPASAFRQSVALPMTASRMSKLLYVANFHFAKGPRAVADAVSKLMEQDLSLQMTWICHPSDHDKVRALFGSPIRERIRLLDWMPQQELVREFDQHGIFLYPSLFDGFGKVFLEAMSRGLCVLGTRAGGMVDLIRDGENGCLADFNHPVQLESQVIRLRQLPELAARISVTAANTAGQHTWERVARQMSHFFQARLDFVRQQRNFLQEQTSSH